MATSAGAVIIINNGTVTTEEQKEVYERIYKPGHPRADVMGFVAVHVLVAEEQLGRYLQPGEIVHHEDFNKLNNNGGNLLFPITRKEHQQLPAFQARFIIQKGLYKEFLDWWRSVKDVIDPVHELEKKLVRTQNAKRRMEVKLRKRKGGSACNL